MAQHLKQVVLILVLFAGVGLLTNALRGANKIEPEKFRETTRPPALTQPPAPPPPPTQPGPDSPPPVADTAPADPNAVTLTDVLKHFKEGTAVFVDARKPEEFAEGHIKGAINVPSTEVFNTVDRVTRFVANIQPVVVYCGGGNCESSHVVADVLRNHHGFADVKVYTLGWEELSKAPQFAELTETGAMP